MSKEKSGLPFGGVFVFIGALVVCGYAVPLSGGNDLVPLGGLFVGAWLGYIFEHILFRLIIIGLFILMIVARQAFFGAVFDANAAEPQQPATKQAISAKDDYVTCWKQPCIYGPASEWSEQHPSGVAIAVAMGTKSIVTDDEIKIVLKNDFKHYGLTDIKFFYEQNDVVATGVTFHIRGGTEGIYRVTEMRTHIPELAKRAKNNNPLFSSSR